MKTRCWMASLLAAFVALTAPTAHAIRTPMPDPAAAIACPPQCAALGVAAPSIPSVASLDAGLEIVSIEPIGVAADGDCLDLVCLVERETHNAVFCIVKSPLGLRDLLAHLTEIQLVSEDNPPLSQEEIQIIQRIYKRHQDNLDAVWADYRQSGWWTKQFSHAVNWHNVMQTGSEALLVHSLREGEFCEAIPKGAQSLLILDSATREYLFGAIAKLTVQASAMVVTEAAKQTALVHLTDEAGRQGIRETGKIIGKHGIFAVPEGVSAEATGLKVLRTGLGPGRTAAAVSIPKAATPLFSRPVPIGPYSAWKFFGGVRYAAPGVIDTATGAFSPTFSLVRPELLIYGPDALFWTGIGAYQYLDNEELWLDDEYLMWLEENTRLEQE